MLEGCAHLRTWRSDGFVLGLFEDYARNRDGYGKTAVRCRFNDLRFDRSRKPLFDEHLWVPLVHAVDSDYTVTTALAFFSVGRRDVEADYFERYSPRALAWRDAGRREELSCLVADLEAMARAAADLDGERWCPPSGNDSGDEAHDLLTCLACRVAFWEALAARG